MEINKCQTEKIVVISLGGSLIYLKGGLNIEFLNNFNKLIRKHVAKGTRFFIICGGGKLSRNYQQAARNVTGEIPNDDVDWLGIHATRMNAQLLRTIFTDIAYPKVLYHFEEKETHIDKPVVVAAGWKPGRSTDYEAVLLARDYKAKNIINLSNIDIVYDRDPQKYPDAKPLEKISWENFEKLVGTEWSPGANLPFDPVATKYAKELNLTVYILKGLDINNFEKALEGKPFKGTIIMPLKINGSFYNHDYFEMGIGYKGYTTTFTGRFFSYLTHLYRAIKVKILLNPRTFLDVGCGIGLMIYFLRKLGVDAYGIEVSDYALAKANKSIKKYLFKGNILKIPFPDNKFEIATSINVLEHLKTKDISKALSECNRVSNKYIIHKIYTKENKWIAIHHKDDLSHVSVFTRKWWEDLFKKSGYKKAQLFYPVLPEYMETIFVLQKKGEIN